MKTVTVKLPEFLNARLDAAAAGKQVSKSTIIRDVLLLALPAGPESGRKPDDRKPSIHQRLKKYQGAGGTGISDLASNPKHLTGYGQ